MVGLKVVSRTGQTVYRGLRFTGDNLVKTAVIARFLDKLCAYVFRLKPTRKRIGLFKGELWLDATTAAPLRLWGDFVKSPSIVVRSFRFVPDYQRIGHCSQPLRLLLTVETRLVGKVEMAVWLHPIDHQSAAATDECGSGSLAIPEIRQ
jgi:hypothetical protein